MPVPDSAQPPTSSALRRWGLRQGRRQGPAGGRPKDVHLKKKPREGQMDPSMKLISMGFEHRTPTVGRF